MHHSRRRHQVRAARRRRERRAHLRGLRRYVRAQGRRPRRVRGAAEGTRAEHPPEPRLHDPAAAEVVMALPKAVMPLFNFMTTRRGQKIDAWLVKTTGHSLFSFLFSRNMGRP